MADTPLSDSFRVTSIVHSITFGDTIGGSVDQRIGWVMSYPGARISPAVAADTFAMSAVARFQTAVAPVAPGTSNTLTFNLLKIGQSSGTVACATMLAGEFHANFNTKPHEYEQHFEYSAGNSENLSPVSAS